MKKGGYIAVGVAVLVGVLVAVVGAVVYFVVKSTENEEGAAVFTSTSTIDPQTPLNFQGSFKMTIPWQAAMANVSSTTFIDTSSSVTAMISEVYRVSNTSGIVKNSRVTSLREGSVIVIFQLFLYNPAELSDPQAVGLLDAIFTRPKILVAAFLDGLDRLNKNVNTSYLATRIVTSSLNIQLAITTTTPAMSTREIATTTITPSTLSSTTTLKTTATTLSTSPTTLFTTTMATPSPSPSPSPTTTLKTMATTLSTSSTALFSTTNATPSSTTLAATTTTLQEETTTGPYVHACGVVHQTPRSRIIGGSESKRGAYPWIVSLYKDGERSCAGSIISNIHVITACHCIEDLGHPDGRLQIVAGSHLVDFSPLQHVQNVSVSAFYKHADYDGNPFLNDIAVLRLSRPLTFDNYVSAVCLPNESSTLPPRCTVAGWGSTTSPRETYPDELREVTMSAYNSSQCRAIFPDFSSYGHDIDYYLSDGVMCAANVTYGGQDACQGDSGGPLFCHEKEQRTNKERYTQFGVVSWGEGCGLPGNPGFYAYLPYFRTWLDDVAIPALAED